MRFPLFSEPPERRRKKEVSAVSRPARITHRVLQVLCVSMLVWQTVFYLAHWSSLPEEPGIHFVNGDTFDVYASKIYGFYPHIITLVTLVLDFVLTWIVGKEKLKLGLKVTERGKRLFIASLVITLDITALFISGCFCCWVYAVSKQVASYNKAAISLIAILLTVLPAAVIFQCIVNAVCKEKKDRDTDRPPEEKKKRILRFLLTGSAEKREPGSHRGLIRAASWVIVGMMTVIMLFIMERLPKDDIADEYHGLAYFANFGGYYAKWLVMLPFIIAVPLMAVFEVTGNIAKKRGKLPLAVLSDRLKLILAVFSAYWELQLGSELPIGAVSVIIFVLLCIWSVVSFFISRKKE